MGNNLFALIVAALIIILIPLVPQMVKFSIKVNTALKLKFIADLYERNFKQVVFAIRMIFVLLIILIIVLLLF